MPPPPPGTGRSQCIDRQGLMPYQHDAWLLYVNINKEQRAVCKDYTIPLSHLLSSIINLTQYAVIIRFTINKYYFMRDNMVCMQIQTDIPVLTKAQNFVSISLTVMMWPWRNRAIGIMRGGSITGYVYFHCCWHI